MIDYLFCFAVIGVRERRGFGHLVMMLVCFVLAFALPSCSRLSRVPAVQVSGRVAVFDDSFDASSLVRNRPINAEDRPGARIMLPGVSVVSTAQPGIPLSEARLLLEQANRITPARSRVSIGSEGMSHTVGLDKGVLLDSFDPKSGG